MQTSSYSPSQQLTCLLPTQEQIDAYLREHIGVFGEATLPLRRAIHESVKAIIRNPDDPKLWNNLGGNFGIDADRALPFYYTAYRIAPHRSKHIDMLANILNRMGDTDAAMRLLDGAVSSPELSADERALLQCYKEEILLNNKMMEIRNRLGG